MRSVTHIQILFVFKCRETHKVAAPVVFPVPLLWSRLAGVEGGRRGR